MRSTCRSPLAVPQEVLVGPDPRETPGQGDVQFGDSSLSRLIGKVNGISIKMPATPPPHPQLVEPLKFTCS